MAKYIIRISILCIFVCSTMVSATAPTTSSFGVGIGTDVGAPAIQWEQSIAPSTAWIATIGLDRAFSGLRVQSGLRRYLSSTNHGLFIQLAGTLGHGMTQNAEWTSLQLSGSGGYAWAIRSRWKATVEIGVGAHAIGVRDVFGAEAATSSYKLNIGVGLMWRL